MEIMKALTISDASTIVLGLQDEIRRSQDARYDHRLHGLLLIAQGMSCFKVADLLGDSLRTVQYWVHRFEERGLAGLQEGSRSGRPSRLNAAKIEDVKMALRKRPLDFGLNGNLWDGKTLAAYIQKKHRVKLGARRCRQFFRQWEFRLRKPRPVIARADPEKQASYKKTPRLSG